MSLRFFWSVGYKILRSSFNCCDYQENVLLHDYAGYVYIPRVTSRQCFIAIDVILSNFETELIIHAN